VHIFHFTEAAGAATDAEGAGAATEADSTTAGATADGAASAETAGAAAVAVSAATDDESDLAQAVAKMIAETKNTLFMSIYLRVILNYRCL
jgi:hypothetical protein